MNIIHTTTFGECKCCNGDFGVFQGHVLDIGSYKIPILQWFCFGEKNNPCSNVFVIKEGNNIVYKIPCEEYQSCELKKIQNYEEKQTNFVKQFVKGILAYSENMEVFLVYPLNEKVVAESITLVQNQIETFIFTKDEKTWCLCAKCVNPQFTKLKYHIEKSEV